MNLYYEKIKFYYSDYVFLREEFFQIIALMKGFFDEKIKKIDTYDIKIESDDIIIKKIDGSIISQKEFLSKYNVSSNKFFEINFDNWLPKNSPLIYKIIFNQYLFSNQIEKDYYGKNTKDNYMKPETLLFKNFNGGDRDLSILKNILDQNNFLKKIKINCGDDVKKLKISDLLKPFFEKQDRFIIVNLISNNQNLWSSDENVLAFNVKEENLGLQKQDYKSYQDPQENFYEKTKENNIFDLLPYNDVSSLNIYSKNPQSIIDVLKDPKNKFKDKLGSVKEIFVNDEKIENLPELKNIKYSNNLHQINQDYKSNQSDIEFGEKFNMGDLFG